MDAKEVVEPLKHLLEAIKVDRNISKVTRQCADDLLKVLNPPPSRRPARSTSEQQP